MVERVKITPSKIVLKDQFGAVKFNTDYAYLKTGSGTLYAGGYARAPAIYGQNTVFDHTDGGGYASGLFSGTIYPVNNETWYLNVPRSNSCQFRSLPIEGGTYANLRWIAASSRFVQYFNYDTRVLSNTSVTFYWQIEQYGYGDNGDGGFADFKYHISPVLSSNTLPAVTNVNGGTFEFAYTGNEHLNYYRTYLYSDDSNTYEATQYGGSIYGERQGDNDGNPYTIPALPIYWKPWGIFTTRPPVALSLAVTP